MKISRFMGVIVLIASVVFTMLLSPVIAGIMVAGIFAPGVLAGEIRNKVGAVVFSKNHFGAFIRGRVKPVNPRSQAQSLVRANLKLLAQTFRTLTQEQIAAWNNLGKNRIKRNKLGFPITLTGETTYIELNRNIFATVGSQIADAPSVDLDNVANLLEVEFASAGGVITVNATAAPATGFSAELQSSGIVSAGRTYNSKYKSFGSIISTDGMPLDISTVWTDVFGTAPVAGEVVFFRIRVIDNALGFASLYQTYRVVAS